MLTEYELLNTNVYMILNPIFLFLFILISFVLFLLLTKISKIKLKEKGSIKNIFKFKKNLEVIHKVFPHNVTISLIILISILMSIYFFNKTENEIIKHLLNNGTQKQDIIEEIYELTPIHDDSEEKIYIHKTIQSDSTHRNDLALYNAIFDNKLQIISPYNEIPNVVIIEETNNKELIHTVRVRKVENYLSLNSSIYDKILLFPYSKKLDSKFKTNGLESDYMLYIFYVEDYNEVFTSDISNDK